VTFYPGAMDAEAAGRITLAAGESATADVSLAPVAARSVSIKSECEDPTVRPRMMFASLYIADGIVETLPTTTGFGQGSIEIGGLPPGRVDITWTTGTGKNAQEHFKAFNSSEADAGSLSALTTIRGVVEGVGGAKVAGTTVELKVDEGSKTYSTVVGPKGEFEFHEELVRGLYTIEVPQLADMQLGIRGNGLSFFDESIEIQPGRDVEMKIMAGRAACVRGRVVKNGAEAEGVFVALVPEKFEDANDPAGCGAPLPLQRYFEFDTSGGDGFSGRV